MNYYKNGKQHLFYSYLKDVSKLKDGPPDTHSGCSHGKINLKFSLLPYDNLLQNVSEQSRIHD